MLIEEWIVMRTKINEALESVLKQFDEKYFIDGIVNKSKVIQDLDTYNEELLTAFLSNEVLKDNFTIDIAGNTVLQTNKLIDLLEADEYWQDSYTKYSKKIGLTAGGKFIDENEDVVLDFPYKDTILKASMSKEDTDKDDLRPDEPFLNEVIAKEEIDVLLDKKILVNAKKYDENGEHEVDSFDEKDNLIIKGNNLLALHTLKERYAGKVKMIYIDPPYLFDRKKSSDTFNYNVAFKTSTWLTFMKNRLEIARELLVGDGVIFISISNYGQAYLKMLMDQVFGQKNYVETFIWKNTDNADSLGMKSRVSIEFIHAYEKVFQSQKKWKGRESQNDDAPLLNASNSVGVLRFPAKSIRFNISDGIYKKGNYPSLEALTNIEVKNGVNVNEVTLKGKFKWGQTYLDHEIKRGTYFLIKSDRFSIRYQKPEASIIAPEKLIDNKYLSKALGIGTNEDSQSHLKQMMINFSYSKPESLIAFLIRAVTEENDIILDFFMGSATTQAVAHKMNRRYIGVEQMDYINTVSVPRLQKVIEGEQGGISKDVNWQGGGSFVYVELMEKNKGFIDAIRKCETQHDIDQLFNFMLEEAEIDFRVDLEKVKDTLHQLSLDDQKRTLFKIIEKNQLYYNYSEIDDENVRDLISDSDYKFNKSFYEGGE